MERKLGRRLSASTVAARDAGRKSPGNSFPAVPPSGSDHLSFLRKKACSAAAAGSPQPHKTSRAEIRELWEIVERDLADAASGGISADWQYGIAYNAALKLCTILLYATGYKPAKGAMAHSRTLNALPHILGT